jgi:hypothetical protein
MGSVRSSRESQHSGLPLHVNENPQSFPNFFDNASQKARVDEPLSADPGTAQPTASDFLTERKIYEKASLNRTGRKRIGDRSAAAFGRSANRPGSEN